MLDTPIRKDRTTTTSVSPGSEILRQFAATSIEELISAVGITKSGFFYHFKDKSELAKGLLLRYLEQDRVVLDDIFRRATSCTTIHCMASWSASSCSPR